MSTYRTRLASLCVAICCMTACGLGSEESWRDQLIADSPCFQVNLLDGLDETSTSEVRALFDCANYHGHLEALEHTVQSQDANTRAGVNPGIELARVANAMPEVDVDPFAIAGLLVGALQAEDRPVEELLDLALELTYGVPATEVRSEAFSLRSPSHLRGGVLAPLAPVLPRATGVLLDDDLEAASWFGGVITDPETKRWIRTFEAYLASENPAISEPLEGLVGHLGQSVIATQSPENDRWPLQSSGNSLRDALELFVLKDDPLMAQISGEAATIVSDASFRAALQPALISLHEEGHLEALPGELLWMASVDVDEQPVPQAGFSALYRFLRLLSAANQPIECELDFLITQLEFSFPNLTVEILELIADLDPDTVEGAVGIISVLTDNFVSEWMLREAVDLQICPDLTHEVLDDLRAIDVLANDETDSLLTAVVELLDVMKNQSDTNQIPVIATLLDEVHVAGGTKVLEELVLDLGDTALLVDVTDLIPALSDPEGYGITDTLQDPAELQDAIALMEWAFVVDEDTQQTGLERMRPLMIALLEPDETWDALDHAAQLMVDDRTQTHHLMELIPSILQIDPELEILDELGPLLGHKPIAEPLMRMLEADGLVASVLAAEPQGESEWVPLSFLGRLVVRGTLDDLLHMIDLVLGDAEGR